MSENEQILSPTHNLDYSNRYALVTFNAHEATPQVFEDYLTLVLPIFHKLQPFAYHIEQDDSDRRHLHAFVTLPETITDYQKIKQKLEPKPMREFKKYVEQDTSTVWDVAANYRLVGDTQHDILLALGYTLKDHCRRGECQFNNEAVRNALSYCAVHQRIKISSTENDWIQIKPANIHHKITSFCDKYKLDGVPSDITYLMTQAKHTFVQISTKQCNLAIAELKVQKKIDNNFDKNIIMSHASDIPNNNEDQSNSSYVIQNEYIAQLTAILDKKNIKYPGIFDASGGVNQNLMFHETPWIPPPDA